MRPTVALLPALLFVTLALLAPITSAEFGPEDEHGWPINVDGEVVKPPIELKQTDFLDSINPYDPLNKIGPVTLYPYYPILTAELMRLADEHPEVVRLTSAGKSVLGLDIWLLEIADFHNPDKIPLEQREVVYIDGGIHSNEYSAVYFLTEVAQFLIEEYETNETARWIVENRHIYLAPMLNPDGSNAFGRMNAHWVNLNRNFPYTWGELDEDIVFNNPGDEPASEPETRIVIDMIDRLQPDYFGSVHCCGNLWLHPWGAEHLADPIDMQMFTRTCDELFADIRDRCGPIWSTIYPAAGSSVDEAYGRIGSAAWGFEMSGRGAIALWGQPAIIEDVRQQERESWGAVMHAMLHVEKYGARPEIRAIEGTSDGLDITIANIGWGPLVAGNLTLAGTQTPLPEIGPENETLLHVPGSFSPGTSDLHIDWTKRIYQAPQGHQSHTLILEQDNGRLTGALGCPASPSEPADPGERETTPAPWPLMVLLAVCLLVLIGRTTRRF